MVLPSSSADHSIAINLSVEISEGWVISAILSKTYFASLSTIVVGLAISWAAALCCSATLK